MSVKTTGGIYRSLSIHTSEIYLTSIQFHYISLIVFVCYIHSYSLLAIIFFVFFIIRRFQNSFRVSFPHIASFIPVYSSLRSAPIHSYPSFLTSLFSSLIPSRTFIILRFSLLCQSVPIHLSFEIPHSSSLNSHPLCLTSFSLSLISRPSYLPFFLCLSVNRFHYLLHFNCHTVLK